MKLKKTSQFVAALIAGFALQLTGNAQIYTLTQDVVNNRAVPVDDVNYGYISLGFLGLQATLSDTVVIDPTAYTIQEYGTISFTGIGISATETRSSATPTAEVTYNTNISTTTTTTYTTNYPGFPAPPVITANVITNTTTTVTPNYFVSGNWNVGMTISTNVSFDTGVQSLIWNGSKYSFNSTELNLQLAADFSYSLVTGGQTYSGTQENVPLYVSLALGNTLDISNYPQSVGLMPISMNTQYQTYPQNTIGSVTAANGFQSDIQVVPEPTTPALLGIGLFALTLLSYHRSSFASR